MSERNISCAEFYSCCGGGQGRDNRLLLVTLSTYGVFHQPHFVERGLGIF